MNKSKINKINKLGLCLGCGLCESVSGAENIEMKIAKDGFIHPEIKKFSKENDDLIDKVCPGKNVVFKNRLYKNERIWGPLLNIYKGYSLDKELRNISSSGGVISTIAIFLLEEKIVDAVLHVKSDKTNYKNNVLSISRNIEEVIEGTSSKYAPAAIFNNILQILETNNNTYCFIGKPCDIVALHNLLDFYPEYKDRFKFKISLICAGMPSYKGTDKLVEGFNAKSPIKNLKYRGDGWPGSFSFEDANEEVFKQTYNDSWGKVLCKNLNFRCKICPDGIGLFADIAVGDAWETKDGYPDFTERDGQSLILSRTDIAEQFVGKAFKKDYLSIELINIKELASIQPYQYSRRGFVIARILAFSIVKGYLLNFKGLALWKNLKIVSFLRLGKEFIGTFYRLIK